MDFFCKLSSWYNPGEGEGVWAGVRQQARHTMVRSTHEHIHTRRYRYRC